MSPRPTAMASSEQPLNLYQAVCVGCLLALTMALLEKQLGVAGFVPACFGLLGTLGCWRITPMLVMASLALILPLHAFGAVPTSAQAAVELLSALAHGQMESLRIHPVPDFLACAALLGFLGAFYRFRGVKKDLFPRDRRTVAPAGPPPAAEPPARRSAEFVQGAEVVLFIATLPICCGLAAFCLVGLGRAAGRLGWFPQSLRAPLLFLWVAAVVLGLLAAVLGYKGLSEAEPEENLQFLQDHLWRQTRHEQSRIQRWSTWARLRAQWREEKS